MLVTDFLRRAAQLYPDRNGVAAGSVRHTYGEFQQRCNRLSNSLLHLRVHKGDRVAILSANTPEYLEAFYGIADIGAVAVPLNYRLVPSDFVYILNHAEAKVFLVDADLLHLIEPIRHELATVRHFVAWAVSDACALPEGWLDYETLIRSGSPESPPDPHLAENDLLTINYTSGTTAQPKGVMLTHRNVYFNAMSFLIHCHLSDQDTLLCMTPYFHVNGWGTPFTATGIGARHCVLRKVDPLTIFNAVREENVTVMCMPPTAVAMLLNCPGAAELARGTCVRIYSGGSPPPAAHIQRLQEEIGWQFNQAYGLTETAPFFTFGMIKSHQAELPTAERIKIQSRAGLELVTSQIRVVDEFGHDVPMDDRTVGEVVGRGNMVMQGYWKNEVATGQAIRDGWFHTGDLATWNKERAINIVDRMKDVIISGGENISSVEVEDTLYQHPAVLECCVIGVPSEKWGETVKAIVVVRPETTTCQADIIAHCRERMAHFKCPTSVDFVPSLPRTATGKLQKYVVRSPYWQGRDRNVH
jgi:fatty-acyl-CoA synthase